MEGFLETQWFQRRTSYEIINPNARLVCGKYAAR